MEMIKEENRATVPPVGWVNGDKLYTGTADTTRQAKQAQKRPWNFAAHANAIQYYGVVY